VQIEGERLLENVPLGLPPPLGQRDEFVVEVGADFDIELLVFRGGRMCATLPVSLLPRTNYFRESYFTCLMIV
jgi:hypothetical protein